MESLTQVVTTPTQGNRHAGSSRRGWSPTTCRCQEGSTREHVDSRGPSVRPFPTCLLSNNRE